jgi:hypothetical protein
VQPDKEYLGRRCADDASGPGGHPTPGPLVAAIGHQSHASKTQAPHPVGIGVARWRFILEVINRGTAKAH